MSDLLLRDALELWSGSEPYEDFPCATILWRLLPAIDHDKIRLFYRDDLCVGLITWAFMTDGEFISRDYSGSEIFSRGSGDKMVFVDMIAPFGRRDVLWMCREMRKQFWTQYPNVSSVFAHRGSRNGIFPNRGIWHENAA
jgi:hemolysin-activating ACP:hemolysin acyltransferase